MAFLFDWRRFLPARWGKLQRREGSRRRSTKIFASLRDFAPLRETYLNSGRRVKEIRKHVNYVTYSPNPATIL
jgi:hypothetical protein